MKKKEEQKHEDKNYLKKLEKFIRLMADKLEKLIHRQPPQGCHLSPHPVSRNEVRQVLFFFFSFFFWVFM